MTGPDISLPRDARFALIGASPIYDPIADYNANGFIDGIDISIARDNRFRFIPFGEPSVPAPVALAAVAAYRDDVDLDAKQSATTDDEGDGRRFLQIRSLKKTPVWLESPLSAWIS